MTLGPSSHADCPHCGFRPMHTRTTWYRSRVIVTHWCAHCQHTFDTEHEARGSEPVGVSAEGRDREPRGGGSLDSEVRLDDEALGT